MTLPPELREAVARIVEPRAYEFRHVPFDIDKMYEQVTEADWEAALAKADAVLALLDPAIAELVEGLKPFAEACIHLHPALPDDGVTLDGFTAKDFRRAAQLVAKYTEKA